MTGWLVIGAGVSGLGAAQWLVKQGERVRVSERSKLPSSKADPFIRLGVELCDGVHALSHLDDVACVVPSPGLSGTHPLLAEARRRGLSIVSEIDLALSAYRGTVLAVTGTNGKSTTCAMLGHLLAKLDLGVTVGGNFGDPPTAMLAEGRVTDYLVLELSSYQLEQSERVAPAVAVFTSFSFDHLARHGSIGGYLGAKWRIFAKLPKAALALVPDGLLPLAAREGLAPPPGAVVVRPDVALAAHGLHEVHNQLNGAFAIRAVAHLTGRSPRELAAMLADFRGLPHRCELVATIAGHPIINDSKSTNLESTLVALVSQRQPVVLMMGGQGKGEPYAPLLLERAKIAALVTFGASGPEIASAAAGHVPVHSFPTLKDALAATSGILEKYACGLLFSPGCASFDEFDDYAHRGEVFKAAAVALAAARP